MSAARPRTGNGPLIAFVAVVLSATAIAAIAARWPREEAPRVDWSARMWRFSQDRLDRLLAHWKSEMDAVAPDDEERKLVELWRELNRVERKTGGDYGKEAMRAAHTRFEEQARYFVAARGLDAYRAAGLRVAMSFVHAVRDAARKARAARARSLDAWVDAHAADDAAAKAVAELGGLFVRELIRRRVLRPNGAFIPQGRALAIALLVARWHLFVRDVHPPERAEPLDERLLVLRWKIEENPELSAERRLQLIDLVEKLDPTYPADLVRAMLLARRGAWADAARILALAAANHPDDEQLQRYARAARARAER